MLTVFYVNYPQPLLISTNDISFLQAIKVFNNDILHLVLKDDVHRPCLLMNWKPRSSFCSGGNQMAAHRP